MYTLYNYTTTFKCPMTVKNIDENNKIFLHTSDHKKNRLSTYLEGPRPQQRSWKELVIYRKMCVHMHFFQTDSNSYNCLLLFGKNVSPVPHSGQKKGNNVYTTCGFMILSKAEIIVFWNFFFTPHSAGLYEAAPFIKIK